MSDIKKLEEFHKRDPGITRSIYGVIEKEIRTRLIQGKKEDAEILRKSMDVLFADRGEALKADIDAIFFEVLWDTQSFEEALKYYDNIKIEHWWLIRNVGYYYWKTDQIAKANKEFEFLGEFLESKNLLSIIGEVEEFELMGEWNCFPGHKNRAMAKRFLSWYLLSAVNSPKDGLVETAQWLLKRIEFEEITEHVDIKDPN